MFIPAAPELLADVPEYLRNSPPLPRTPRPGRRTPDAREAYRGPAYPNASPGPRAARVMMPALTPRSAAAFAAQTPRAAAGLLPRRADGEAPASHAPRSAPDDRGSSPLTVGVLLLVAPPLGLTLLWSSPRFGREARLALTIMTGLGMGIAAIVALALVFTLR